jgi:hypothetical protein
MTVGLRQPCKSKVETRVGVSDGGSCFHFVEPFARVLADRLQHPEPRLTIAVLLLPEQVLLDERGQAIEDIDALPGSVAHRFDSVDATTADEDAQPREQRLLLAGQKLETPRDRRSQRPLALRRS